MESEPLLITQNLLALGAQQADLNLFEELLKDIALPIGARLARVARAERSAVKLLLSADAGVEAGLPSTGEAVVGDWVIFEENANGLATVLLVVPRRNAIVRRSSGGRSGSQILAANIDNVVITIGSDQPINQARVERMLALAWESGAEPVVALTKAELLSPADRESALEQLTAVTLGTAVVAVSAVASFGITTLLNAIYPGGTIALLGLSGAGKSTLMNTLTSQTAARTAAVRVSDHKGRHVTAWRQLVCMPSGGAIIDTPGLRQLGLWIDRVGLRATFADVDEVSVKCRFSDCTHKSEPGCAVSAAVLAGTLDLRRVDHYEKLKNEVEAFENQADPPPSGRGRGRSQRRPKDEIPPYDLD